MRDNVTDYAHPVGACRMGSSPSGGAVVDARGPVHGLTNVFVADAPVIPRIPRANIDFTGYVVGMTIASVLASRP